MDDTQMMVLELGSQGYTCAQIVLAGGLRLMGRENPDLIRAMAGLAQGVACSGEICGALSGGVCLIALHSAKGMAGEEALPEGQLLMNSLVEWFREEHCGGGAVSCDALLGVDGVCSRSMDAVRCGGMVGSVWNKAVSLLVESGIDPTLGRETHE